MINLLPPKEKEYLVSKKTERLVIVLGLMLIVSLGSCAMILYALQFYILREVVIQKNVLSDVEYLDKDTNTFLHKILFGL